MNDLSQAGGGTDAGPGWGRRWLRIVVRLVVAILITVMFGRVLHLSVQVSQREGRVPGFALGMAHGALMPCGFPMLLVGQDLPIYAERNTGRTYKLGYTLGVNLCGAVFFGSVYWRVGRLRRLARELQSPSARS
ncbi:MAG: hypothetical protein MUE94_09750 [Verrucomicrobia bacterium]|nr:hypothetical protein [Verrucomicrobiota bacterium]